ncbi:MULTISPECIES: hypothetical protein [unclassified Polaromonas]|uniref:hypothetical protein n=1 Tax=unclassified Polaromonas TaxID=2638319 RepID=UPI000F0816D8|nr:MULTISPECIES: hypothetical protein [unclassified Polaromonas]AYQ29016.1 hypothetical protein DT070_13905 [Polaromonas sp. SP1]QGJ19865.1 hypothetical protein F7R28_16700 [Polaromonas sp. Pch-P]
MKKLILLALVAAGAWWYFAGGRKLSDEHVRAFYRGVEVATLERKPQDLCALLADNFESTGTVTIGGQSHTETQNKAGACAAYQGLYESWEKLGEKMGGTLQLDFSYTVHSVAISPDNKTATVDISSSLDVAGSIMNIRSRSTDTLIRRNGKVLLLRSESKGFIQ